MNIIDIQDSLKDLSESQLIKEMQMPTGNAPQFLVLGEIQRRKRMRDDFAAQQASQQGTVAQEAVAAMGIPQAAGMDMRQSMNPKSSMVQNAPSGGIADIAQEQPMKMNEGGLVSGLFANTDRGRNTSDKGYEIRTNKDGEKVVYKAGTNIYLGKADKLFGDSQSYMEGGVLKFDKGGDTLGIRNMNPGNIRPGAKFFGESGSKSGYATFKTPAHGLRALARLFQTYKDEHDIDTIDEFVDRYAPADDNDEKSRQNYKQFLADALNVGVNDEVDLVARSEDLIPAVTKFENAGNMPYSDDMVSAAIKSSSLEDEAEVDSMLAGFGASSTADFSTSQAAETEPSLLNKLGLVSQASASSTLNNAPQVTDEDQMKIDMIETYRTSDDPEGMDAENTLKEIIRDTDNNSSAVRVAAQKALNEIVSPKTEESGFFDFLKGTGGSADPLNLAGKGGRGAGMENSNNPLASIFGAGGSPTTPVGASTTTQGNVGGFQSETEEPNMLDGALDFLFPNRGNVVSGGADPLNLAGKGGRGTGIENPNNPLASIFGSSRPTDMLPTTPEDAYDIGKFGEMGPPPEDDEFGNIAPDGSMPATALPATTLPAGVSTTTQGNTVGMPGTTPMPDTQGQGDDKQDLPFGDPYGNNSNATTSSDLMAEIDEMRAKLDKDRDSDKWLALAQAGMALMSSTNPTLMGALGEAGMSGLTALRGSEGAYDKGVASLLSAKSKLIPKAANTTLTQSQAMTQINQITELLNKTVEVPDPTDPTGMGKKRQYVVIDPVERQRLTNLLTSLYGKTDIADLNLAS